MKYNETLQIAELSPMDVGVLGRGWRERYYESELTDLLFDATEELERQRSVVYGSELEHARKLIGQRLQVDLRGILEPVVSAAGVLAIETYLQDK